LASKEMPGGLGATDSHGPEMQCTRVRVHLLEQHELLACHLFY
jgi:hypothetical protein